MAGSIRVVNMHTATPEECARAIYIGRVNRIYSRRESWLANPYKVGPDMTRETAIKLYRIWLWQHISEGKRGVYRELERIAKKVKAGEEVLLLCFCTPKPCHGDVVAKAIEWMIREGKV
jgi:hypothetical protein